VDAEMGMTAAAIVLTVLVAVAVTWLYYTRRK
jgi:hypothetical protein